jgi:hypothetical protein
MCISDIRTTADDVSKPHIYRIENDQLCLLHFSNPVQVNAFYIGIAVEQ